MTKFLPYLIELRGRLLKALLAIVITMLVLLPFSNQIYQLAATPLSQLLPEGSSMIATDVTSPFFTPFKLTLTFSFFVSLPLVLYQFWAFVAPALYRHEKKRIVPLLFMSLFLFYTGVLFAYFVVLPLAFSFFVTSAPANVQVMTDINAYSDFILSLFIAFGLAFQLPVITYALLHANVVTVQSLTKQRPYVIIGVFTIGMLLTPPDIISQSLLAIPMWGLFELGLLLGKVTLPKKEHQRVSE